MGRYVTLDVNVEDVVFELDDESLIAEIKRRYKIKGNPIDFTILQDAYDALKRGDDEYGMLLLERILKPKWATPEEALEAIVKMEQVQ